MEKDDDDDDDTDDDDDDNHDVSEDDVDDDDTGGRMFEASRIEKLLTLRPEPWLLLRLNSTLSKFRTACFIL